MFELLAVRRLKTFRAWKDSQGHDQSGKTIGVPQRSEFLIQTLDVPSKAPGPGCG